MEKEKLRSEIKKEYKWDIEKIFSNKEEINQAILEVEDLCKKIVEYHGFI